MAKNIGPKRKYLRRFGLLPEDANNKKRQPKAKKTEYGKRLEEKQKLKFIYNVTEKKFLRYVKTAKKSKGNDSELILVQLESRLDNVIYRSGFARTREQARQFVSHNHVLVDDKKLNIPSYEVSAGQKITLKEKIFANPLVQEVLEEKKKENFPSWLERKENSVAIRHLPESDELPKDVDMQMVLGFYR